MSSDELNSSQDEVVRSFLDPVRVSLTAILPAPGSTGSRTSVRSDDKVGLIVAFSGGPDSTALLFALHMVAEEFGLHLKAVHVNHGLRGAESDDDEIFCQRVCEKLQIEFASDNLGKTWRRQSPSEEELRDYRYDVLAEHAKGFETDLVAVAHTVDDQAETLLFRICRGTAPAGLSGMQELSQSFRGITILRPTLKLRRQDCLRFLATLTVGARQDSSNLDTKFARNFIRHDLIPLIESRFPGFIERAERLRIVAADEDEYMTTVAQDMLTQLSKTSADRWSRADFAQLHLALQRRIIVLALENRDVDVSFERVQSILELSKAQKETRFSLDDQWDVGASARGDIVWFDKYGSPLPRLSQMVVRMPGHTVVPAAGQIFCVEVLDEHQNDTGFPPAKAMEALVDLSQVHGTLFLRQRQEGDYIQPFGMQERVKLKKYLHTHKRESASRPPLAGLLLAQRDEILWVPGVGLSERLRATGRPSHRLSWTPITDSIGLA